jgi:GntR family transcriptional regulator
MIWHLDADSPLYSQIISNIEIAIASGYYKPGSQIPPVRTLAMEAGVNPNTMQRALEVLEQKNLLYSQRTKGRFITSDESVIADMKKGLAKDKIMRFVSEMRKLGFTADEILEQVKENLNIAGEQQNESV